MQDLLLVCLSALCLLLLTMVFFLQYLLVKAQGTPLILLREQQKENQLLRNQLRAADVQTLASLNHVTLPSKTVASNDTEPDELTHEDLGEAINYELDLAKQGYSLGDLGDDLESSGWAPPVIRREPDAGVTAYEPS